MNLDRIRSSVDVSRTQAAKVVAIGGAFGLMADLARCGVGRFTHIDFGRVDVSNPARQDLPNRPGEFKTDMVAEALRAINSDVVFIALKRDVCSLSDEEVRHHIGGADLLIDATDSFAAKARSNQIALEYGIPFLSSSIYEGGRGGEVIWHRPSHPPLNPCPNRPPAPTSRGASIVSPRRCACYRCIAGSRYRAFAEGGAQAVSGGTIMDLRVIDGIAGQIALGILTQGADNRMGRLIDQLDGRQLLVVKLDPSFTLGDPDLFSARLGADPAHFAFNTVALRVRPDPSCPDCARFARPAVEETPA